MNWTREQTAEVLEMYLKKRPRTQDKTEPQVQELAKKLGRTPASVSMKMANFIFLDPLAEQLNRKGMSQISELDKAIWLELSGSGLSNRSLNNDSAATPLTSNDMTLDLENISNPRVVFSLMSKPFLILTGNSGTGKTLLATQLAEKFSIASEIRDPFFPGAEIASDRISYFVGKSDSHSVEFWNSKDSSTTTKVTLPREVIGEWAKCITGNGWDGSATARQIREAVAASGSNFSSQIHSFETHLKAAAFALLKVKPEAFIARNSALVAVGADWTDNRNVVGYVNHLREIDVGGHKRPVYQTTPVLDLLLEASKPGREAVPHFLILDEMNLSHVERYFADFLSSMEARDGAVRLHSEGDFRLLRFEGDTLGVPQLLPYPANLFVIGTVNVDETTYMFSPKVLDRAHVIEFEVDPEDVGRFLEDPKPLKPVPRAAAGQAEEFLKWSLRARGLMEPALPELPPAVKAAANKHLLEVLEILQNGRFEFAFRTAKEVVAYLKISRELAADKAAWDTGAWKADLDDEILQKILPKLSGSKRRIEALLVRLARYCETGVVHKIEESTPAAYQSSPVKRVDATKCKFARSHGKLCDMIDAVRRDQFVSFIH